jgi:hypothetical protein
MSVDSLFSLLHDLTIALAVITFVMGFLYLFVVREEAKT